MSQNLQKVLAIADRFRADPEFASLPLPQQIGVGFAVTFDNLIRGAYEACGRPSGSPGEYALMTERQVYETGVLHHVLPVLVQRVNDEYDAREGGAS